MPRSDIASQLNLTPATVTSICNDFMSKGVIIPTEETLHSNGAGRKKSPVAFNYNYKYVIACYITPDNTYIQLCNLAGNPLSFTSIPTISEPHETFLKQIASESIRLIWDNKMTVDDILGVGVTTLGPVNHVDGIAINAFNIWKKPVNIKKTLENELHLPVCLESNVCSSLYAELLYTKLSEENILAVKWGPGVGSASIIGGKVFKGRQYHSSELGHNFVDWEGKLCRCGKRGCLETKISMEAIISQIKDMIHTGSSLTLSKAAEELGEPTQENINRYFDLEDESLSIIFDEISNQLAIVVNNAIQILAPNCLILSGSVFNNQSMLTRFKRQVFKINDTLNDDMFLHSSFPDNKHLIGAVAVAVKRLLVDTAILN